MHFDIRKQGYQWAIEFRTNTTGQDQFEEDNYELESAFITLASVFPTLDMLRFRDNCGAGIRCAETFLV